MSKTEFEFDGFLSNLEKQTAKMLARNNPEAIRRKVYKIAEELRGRVVELTPKDTGGLRSAWTVGNVVQRGNEWYVEVYNNMEYAAPIEYGHRAGKNGFVQGWHMMEISLAELAAVLPDHLKKWLDDILEGVKL